MWLWLCAVVFLGGWQRGGLLAQDAPRPQDEPITTLHVYANLVQVPTLVLGPYLQQVKPIAENRFSVSIDNGPWFRATHVHMAEDEPISLSILLDVSGNVAELMPKIDEAIAGLAPLSLHPEDRVSIYALDCSLTRSGNNFSAESAVLKNAVDSALRSWTDSRANKHEPKCEHPIHLWDGLAYVVSELYKVPGRRVILVVSDGRDRGSRRSWNDVRAFAQSTGATVFGMIYLPQYPNGNYTASGNHMVGNRIVGSSGFGQLGTDDPFQMLCQMSGGMVLSSSSKWLDETLRRFTTMVRGRYIVEFPRPAKSTAGQHNLQVRVEKSGPDIVRWAGISVPVPDAAVLADPTTVHSDPSLTPQLGKGQSMKKP
jgi:hypothetical protein